VPTAPPGPRFGRPLLFLAAFVAASLATRWLSLLVHVIDVDEAAHIVGSWEWLRGGLLYTDFVDNKPPLLYGYYALAQAVLGRSLIAVHAVTASVVVPLTALAVAAFYRCGPRGVVAAVAFLLYSSAFLAHDMLASNAEVLMMLPGAWALVVIGEEHRARSRTRLAVAGALVGVAFLFKYQIALWLPGLAGLPAWVAFRQRGARHALSAVVVVMAGFLLPLLAVWVWFDARGGAEALIYWTIRNNLSYTANPVAVSEAVERALSYLVPFLIVTAPLWFASWWLLWSDEPAYRRALLGSVVVLSMPAALLGFRFYPHYFIQLYVPLALAAAPWLEAQWRPTPTRAGRAVAAWTIAMVVGFTIANVVLYFGGLRVYRELDPVYREVAGRLRADACASRATMFVWGYAPPFYYYADLPAASRFVVMAQARLTPYVAGNRQSLRAGFDAGQVVPRHWDWLMDDLERNRATYIVDTAPAGIYGWNQFPIDDYPRLRRYLDVNYELLDVVRKVRVFRRRGCDMPGS
jgi:hypothetical protein